MLKVKKGDYEEYDPPNDLAISRAGKALEFFESHRLEPVIRQSCENGICLSFQNNKRYSDIEFYNDGDICAINSLGDGKADIWLIESDEMETGLSKIVAFQTV